jgi:hypothetical protein
VQSDGGRESNKQLAIVNRQLAREHRCPLPIANSFSYQYRNICMKILTLLLFPILSFGQIKPYQKISLLDNKVEILAPKELSKMPDTMWTLKYHNFPRPILALSDKDGEVNLLVDLTQQAAVDSQMTAYKDFRIKNLKKTRTDIKILEEGIKNVNGKHIGFIKFSSQATDQYIFNYYAFAAVHGKILALNFNCIEKLQKTWEKVADEIVASLRTK